MTLSAINLWIAHALGMAFLGSVVFVGIALFVFSGVSLFRLRHA